MEGFKSCECMVCWDRKRRFLDRIEDLEAVFANSIKKLEKKREEEYQLYLNSWKSKIVSVNSEYHQRIEIEPVNAKLELIESYLFRITRKGKVFHFYFNYRTNKATQINRVFI
jgi:hypothetical protein